MKPQEYKEEFILMRAEGKSFETISKELGISKGTCHRWEEELKHKITVAKQESMNGLYERYGATREARIKKLGGVLERLEGAIENADFSMMTPKELLELKLKYTAALKEEYVPPIPEEALPERMDGNEIMKQLKILLDRVRSGELSTEQANRESAVLVNIIKAYEHTQLQERLDVLEAVVGSRK